MKETIETISKDVFRKKRTYRNKSEKKKYRRDGSLRRSVKKDVEYSQTPCCCEYTGDN